MKKLLVVTAASIGLILSSAAGAAQIEIFFQVVSCCVPGTPQSTRMYVSNHGTVGVGAIQILVTGPSSLSLNYPAIPGLSPADSLLSINPLGDGQNILILQNALNGVSIVDAGAQGVWLATLSGSYLSFAQGSEFVLDSSTVYDAFGGPIRSVTIYDYHGYQPWYSYEAPEPTTVSLLLIAMAVLGVAGRSSS